MQQWQGFVEGGEEIKITGAAESQASDPWALSVSLHVEFDDTFNQYL